MDSPVDTEQLKAADIEKLRGAVGLTVAAVAPHPSGDWACVIRFTDGSKLEVASDGEPLYVEFSPVAPAQG